MDKNMPQEGNAIIPTPPLESSISLTPTIVSLEVLSNGTTHISPSILIRTPFRVYLFNCPEGAERFFSALRLRSTVVSDFFFTRAQWNNIAGVSSILLGRQNMIGSVAMQCNLHGPPNIRKYLEFTRPFFDTEAEYRYPVIVKEYTYLNQKTAFEDDTLKVHQIPILPLELEIQNCSRDETYEYNYVGLQNSQEVGVAFLVELKPGLKKIDVNKLMALKIPFGPQIGQLKVGKAITLGDGRVIQPEQVYEEKQRRERPKLLVVELDSIAKLHSLSEHPVLQGFTCESRLQQMNYVVHFTPQTVLRSSNYAKWMASFGNSCTHILLNGSGPIAPQTDRLYRAQILHRTLFPEAFPQLFPLKPLWNFGFDGVMDVNPDRGGFEVENVIAPTPIRRFPMRGELSVDMDQALLLRPFFNEFTERLCDADDFRGTILAIQKFVKEKQLLLRRHTKEADFGHIDIIADGPEYNDRIITELNNELTNLQEFHEDSLIADGSLERYPQIAFLGTSSAVPGNYRNVSSTLVELSPTAAILVDVGEGTIGQMRVLYGPERLSQLLLRLHAIFTTHSHQDHVHGLNGVIIARLDAFKNAGIPYKPLLVVCNRNFRRLFNFYSTNFQNLENCIRIVDISMYPRTFIGPLQSVSTTEVEKTEQAIFLEHCNRLVINLLDQMPEIQDWGCALIGAKAVHVFHTKMAVGFVFQCGPPMYRKLVFSGDTTPCQLLIEEGKGADLLIHECTFEDGLEKDAKWKKHCTMRQATNVANEMDAKNVMFNHFSARYVRCPPIPDYLIEAGNISFAMDGMVVRFDTLPLFPKLLRIFKHLYHRELFNLYTIEMKRHLRIEQGQKEIKEETINSNHKKQRNEQRQKF